MKNKHFECLLYILYLLKRIMTDNYNAFFEDFDDFDDDKYQVTRIIFRNYRERPNIIPGALPIPPLVREVAGRRTVSKIFYTLPGAPPLTRLVRQVAGMHTREITMH